MIVDFCTNTEMVKLCLSAGEGDKLYYGTAKQDLAEDERHIGVGRESL